MLSNVLLTYVFRFAAVAIGAAALVASLLMGADAGIGVFVGGGLVVFDGVALVFLVGRLMDPTVPGTTKGLFTALLVGKLSIVAGLLWASLSVWSVDPIGLMLGMCAGLSALVLGLNRGSTSDAGLAAISEEEARIAQEMGDNEDEIG